MRDRHSPDRRSDNREPEQAPSLRASGFMERIDQGAQFKPETAKIPILLSIVNCRDLKQAQRLAELYLDNRDLGVTGLPEAERDAICLKIRSTAAPISSPITTH